MSFKFDETIRAVYYVSGHQQDWMAAINEDPVDGSLTLRWRFRYYDPLDPENHPNSGKDKRNWDGAKVTPQPGVDGLAMVMQTAQALVDGLLAHNYAPKDGISCKLLRRSMTLKQFIAEFERLPFVYKYEAPPGPEFTGKPWR